MNQKFRTTLVLSLLLLTGIGALAQQNKIDSLLNLLQTEKTDTGKAIDLRNLCTRYKEMNSYDSALKYGKAALHLALDIHFKKGITSTYSELGSISEHQGNYAQALVNYSSLLKYNQENQDRKGISTAYLKIGQVNKNRGNYPEALLNYNASLKIEQELKDKAGISRAYSKIALVYYDEGNYPEALKNHLLALKLNEEIGDKSGIAGAYHNIGNIYRIQGDHKDALENYFNALHINEETKNRNWMASNYSGIATIYTDEGKYPEALKNYLACLKIKEELHDKAGVAAAYQNIGIVNTRQGNFSEALSNYSEALKIFEAQHEKRAVAASYCNIGEVFLKQKKFREAAECLGKAEVLSKSIRYKDALKAIYTNWTELDSAKGDYKGAFENHKQYILYRDSLDNEESRKKIIQSQMTYDFEKKEAIASAEHKKELENQANLDSQESRKQKIIIGFVAFGLILVLAFALYIFRTLRVTRTQKHIIEEKINMVEEKQKEILDSIHYAKRIQNALLKEEDHVSEHLPEHFILFKPKDIVSGDFYWAMEKQDYLYLAAVDCTGHGVPGALMSMLGISFLNEITSTPHLYSPAEILNQLRSKVVKELGATGHTKDGMDISLCRFNLKTKEAEWAGANNPLWICKQKDGQLIIQETKGDKQPVGYSETYKSFTNHAFAEKDCIYYLLTDGFADQFGGPKGKKFKYKKLQEYLIGNSHLPLSQQKEKLADSFDRWKGDLEQVDDICIIGIRI
jgi:tetratricopeptide (TPR) repeat protein